MMRGLPADRFVCAERRGGTVDIPVSGTAMPEHDASILPPPSPEHRRVAAGQFERANQVIATGNFDYGIRLLLSCCTLGATTLTSRQALRRTEKTKYKNNLRGSWHAWLTTFSKRAKVKAAKRA